MEFDQFTVCLLILNLDGPDFTEDELDQLQDAHMAHLADLHDQGVLLAAGPTLGPDDRKYRGFAIFGVDAERALALHNSDPAVVAGRYVTEVIPWLVPRGAMHFTPTTLPRSMAEAMS